MAAARKKVIVRGLDDSVTWGYLPAEGLAEGGWLDFLDVSGKANSLAMIYVKTIAYVKDFNLEDEVEPERWGRRAFFGRPRSEGIWVRVTFANGDTLEGMAGVDLGFLDFAIRDGGVMLTPPDARSNVQRVFVPRSAMAGFEGLGYVATPAKKAVAKRAKPLEGQTGLFDPPAE